MTAPAASFTRLAPDGNYGGKFVKVIQRTVGSDVTYSHVQSHISQSKINGVYDFHSGTPFAVVATAQDGITTGSLWFQNPSASVNLRIRRLEVAFTTATATAIVHDTSPRIAFARGAFTGSFAGATLTFAKRKTADSSNVTDIRTASTGATVTPGNLFWLPTVPANDITTADVLAMQFKEYWRPRSEDEYLILAQNECLVVYQLDNATTNDQRVFTVTGTVDEIDIT